MPTRTEKVVVSYYPDSVRIYGWELSNYCGGPPPPPIDPSIRYGFLARFVTEYFKITLRQLERTFKPLDMLELTGPLSGPWTTAVRDFALRTRDVRCVHKIFFAPPLFENRGSAPIYNLFQAYYPCNIYLFAVPWPFRRTKKGVTTKTAPSTKMEKHREGRKQKVTYGQRRLENQTAQAKCRTSCSVTNGTSRKKFLKSKTS